MDSFPKGKTKKGLISKTWERCKSFSGGTTREQSSSEIQNAFKIKSKSWPRNLTLNSPNQEKRVEKKSSGRVAPEGCFSIYVGPLKQKFVVKTEYVNHPLFKILLEEAEIEYGYSSEGPIALPCEVDHFIKVLMEVNFEENNDKRQLGCNFVARGHSSYHQFTPTRSIRVTNNI